MIALEASRARALIHPERGCWLSSLIFDGTELLYAHPAPPPGDLPGGLPILYPICGRPPASSPHPFHGYAWRLPWTPLPPPPRPPAQNTCPYNGNMFFRLDGPDSARLTLRLRLTTRRFLLALTVQNRSSAPIRPHAGFHPYFRDIATVSVPPPSPRWAYAPDYIHLLPGPLPPPPMPIPASDPIHRALLLQASEALLLRHDGRTLHLRATPSTLPFLQFYADGHSPFLAVEPWSAPAGATAPDAPLPPPLLPPHSSRTYAFTLTIS